MIDISLKDLISCIPDLVNLFLSGFIFVSIYNWLQNKNVDVSIITVWSLFISILIKTFYSMLHSMFYINYNFNEYIKIIIYVLTGAILPFIIVIIQNCKPVRIILSTVNHKSINGDVFDDIIDYNKKTMLQVYLKDSDIYYIGTFEYREEKGLDSYIVLIDYASLDKRTANVIFNPGENGLKSTVALNLRDIDRIELIYEEDSEVWQRLSGNQSKL